MKVAITCSEAFVVEAFGDAFFEAIAQADLLFCNASEAQAVTRTTTARGAFEALANVTPAAVVTDGPHGAYFRYDGSEGHAPAFPCAPVDLTGAGDMFAGTFLYGITSGVSAAHSARAACYLAMKVITQVGARLHHGTRQFWEEALGAAT